MSEPEVGKVVRDLRRSRAVLAALLPAVGQQGRAVKVALEAMEVLYPRSAPDADEVLDFDDVTEWVIVGRGGDGREVVDLAIPTLNRESSVGRRRSRSSIAETLLEPEFDSSTGQDESNSGIGSELDATPCSGGPAEPVEIRTLTAWALDYLKERQGEHFSVRRLREHAIEQLGLTPEQVEHDRFRLALIEARAQDSALVQPNRKAWMYRRGIGQQPGEAAE